MDPPPYQFQSHSPGTLSGKILFSPISFLSTSIATSISSGRSLARFFVSPRYHEGGIHGKDSMDGNVKGEAAATCTPKNDQTASSASLFPPSPFLFWDLVAVLDGSAWNERHRLEERLAGRSLCPLGSDT